MALKPWIEWIPIFLKKDFQIKFITYQIHSVVNSLMYIFFLFDWPVFLLCSCNPVFLLYSCNPVFGQYSITRNQLSLSYLHILYKVYQAFCTFTPASWSSWLDMTRISTFKTMREHLHCLSWFICQKFAHALFTSKLVNKLNYLYTAMENEIYEY